MADDLTGKLIAEKYRVGDLIGESELGDLFAAHNEILDRPVTMKILPRALAMDQRWSKRFLDEARAAATVNHPNILNLNDFGSDSRGVPYAVYEPIEGTQLADLISAGIDENRSIELGRQIAVAVAAAHGRKLVHGRLSPQAVFVATDEQGRDHVKVYGLGADPLSIGDDADPRYLAPEQCGSFSVADDRTDIYSLGVMLYEMISGVRPYEGTTAAEVQEKAATEPPPPLSAFKKDIDPDIEPIILTAMATSPERRYQTMKSFEEDLALFSTKLPAKPAAAAAAAVGGRSFWKTGAIAFAGIALLAVALIYATSSRGTDPTETVQADIAALPVQPIGPATGFQEDSLAKLPIMTDAEIMAAANQTLLNDLPGGDGYNAWATGAPPPGAPPLGVVPPAGAPLGDAQAIPYVAPGGQMYTVPSAGSGSQFMPSESGVILVPVPVDPNAGDAATKPAANTAAQPSPTPAGAKPMATPPARTKAASEKAGTKPTPSTKKPDDEEDQGQ